VLGGLVMSLEAIRVLEESAGDNTNELQKNLAIADECGNKSCCPVAVSVSYLFSIYLNVENEDECVAAADIYQCGKEKAPEVTNAIQNSLTDTKPNNVGNFKYFWESFKKHAT
jgi:hypothetical protein